MPRMSELYSLASRAEPKLQSILETLLNPKPTDFANAREVRKIYERAIECQANRIADTSCTNEELNFLRIEDIGARHGRACTHSKG